VRALIDTHVFLWLVSEPERLGDQRDLVADSSTELLFSAASSWEVSIKYALGRLELPTTPERFVPQQIRDSALTAIPVEHAHALAAGSLTAHHRDPFDRLLVAQARELRVPIITADPVFSAYEVEVLRP
jgi:PIN domain nuclease of toxin-antitoxin system